MRLLLVSLILYTGLMTATVFAEQNRPATSDRPPPPADDTETMEPEITIIRRDGETIEEYRINGQLYMIRITPGKGYPYYLMDADGDGSLESRSNELDPRILVPSWVILRW